MAHPVRLRILSLLTGAELSAAEVARELALTHANASYHLRQLATAGEVVEAGRERIRGGVAKRYRHPWEREPESGLTDAPDSGHVDASRLFARAMATELERRFGQRKRGASGTGSNTDAELWVDPQVWQQVVAMVDEASRQLHAEAKPPRTPGTVHVNMTAALFLMVDGDGRH